MTAKVGASAEPPFVAKIRDSITAVLTANPGTKMSPLLKAVYKESAFTLLEKLLQSTPYMDSLMVFVFHLSHLLLRMLLYPDAEQCYLVFSRLFTFQTRKLIEKAGHLLDFNEWLCYIDAIEGTRCQKAITLLRLIAQELDFDNPNDFRKAEDAVKEVLKDSDEDRHEQMDEYGGEDKEQKVWLLSKNSKSYLLLKLQQAFCARQFAKAGAGDMDHALAVLL